MANLSLANLEFKQQVTLQYPFFSHYIDDVYTLVYFIKASLKKEIEKFNFVKKQLKNIYAPSGLKLNFRDLDNTGWILYLDIRILRHRVLEGSRLLFELYIKKMHKFQISHFNFFGPERILVGQVVGRLARLFNKSSY